MMTRWDTLSVDDEVLHVGLRRSNPEYHRLEAALFAWRLWLLNGSGVLRRVARRCPFPSYVEAETRELRKVELRHRAALRGPRLVSGRLATWVGPEARYLTYHGTGET